MDNNSINENDNEDNDRISIHSIVSEQADFDSDIEAPQDAVNQVDKIILNHVIKMIKIPGRGVDKPSKLDYVKIKYKCYFKDDKENSLIETKELNDYLNKIILPYGIVKTITFMRKGEMSIITLEPKYGFRKVTFDKMNRYIETDKIILKEGENLESLLKKMSENTLIYEIELIDYIKLYDLTGKRELLKRILVFSDNKKGTNRPDKGSEIIINLSLYQSLQKVIELENINLICNETNFSELEIIIIKSMKKGEKCIVDVRKDLFKESCLDKKNENNILIKELKNKGIKIEDLFQGRIQYEMELIKFKNNISFNYYKEKEYRKLKIINGIGNLSPLKDSLIMLACELSIGKDNKIIYSDFNKSKDEYIKEIKDLKHKIKKLPFYEQQIQFMVDEELKNKNYEFPIYEPLEMNFPNLFRKDILVTMKPLNLITLSFTIEKENYEDNYFQLGKDRKCFDEYFKFDKEKSIDVEFTCCLLNFEENLFVLHNKLIENKTEKLLYYKEISNEFYKKGMIHKSKKINKKIADIYIKYVNLDNRNHIAYNDQVFKEIEDVTTTKSYNKEIDDVIKKIMSNLVIFLYKMGRKDQCLKYINEFLKLYLKDEKVQYYQYLILNERGEYESAKNILKIIISLNPNEKLYKEYLTNVEEKIGKNKEKQVNYMKKMIKANQS